MAKNYRTLAAFICALTYSNLVATSRAADLFEVVSVEPSNVIVHDVYLKGRFDEKAIETFINGPRMFSQAVGFGEPAAANRNAYLNWYRITRPITEPRRILQVRDSLHGDEVHKLAIENAAFLLSPAQKVSSGPPSEVAGRLSYFKAYDVLNGRPLNRDIELTQTLGRGNRSVLQPVFFCVPVEEWHHHDHFPIKNLENCMVVYELKPSKQEGNITTIDQFGLNRLKTDSNQWLCVPATIDRATTDKP